MLPITPNLLELLSYSYRSKKMQSFPENMKVPNESMAKVIRSNIHCYLTAEKGNKINSVQEPEDAVLRGIETCS
jgi:hypothetical protein